MESHPEVERATGTELDPRRFRALIVVLSAAFLAVLDFFIVNISIPTIRVSLGASFSEMELVIAVYGLVYSIGLITGGRLGDIYGRKRIFLNGMVAFSAASLLCGCAPTAVSLIVARGLQGAAAALMFPQVLSIIRVSFPPEERARAFGAYGTAIGLASILGPLIGGLLLRCNLFGLSWRPIFLVNLPVGIWALTAGSRLVPESKAPKALRPDFAGVVLVSTGLLLLMLPIALGRELGWPLWIWACFFLAPPVLALFLWHQNEKGRKGQSPLLELSLFRYAGFRAGLLVTVVFFTGLSAFFLILALFLELGLRLPSAEAGLFFAPFAIGFVASSNLSAWLTERVGRVILQWGTLCMAGGLLILSALIAWKGVQLPPPWMIPPLLLYGFGQGLVVSPSVYIILGSVPADNAGSASGTLATTQQGALAFGVALIGGFFFGRVGTGGAESFVHAFPTALRLNLFVLALTFALIFLLPNEVRSPHLEAVPEL